MEVVSILSNSRVFLLGSVRRKGWGAHLHVGGGVGDTITAAVNKQAPRLPDKKQGAFAINPRWHPRHTVAEMA